MTTAASVAALRNSAKSFRLQGGSSRLSLQKRSERKVEGEHDLEMLMLDGYGNYVLLSPFSFQGDKDCFNRTWQIRRVKWTVDMLLFSRVKETDVVDCIPMHEVLCVSEMHDSAHGSPSTSLYDASYDTSGLMSDHERDLEENNVETSVTVAVSSFSDRIQSTAAQKFLQRKTVQGQVNTLQIKTIPDGYNSGRTYYLRAQSESTCRKITSALNKLCTAARERASVKSRFEKVQLQLRGVYCSTPFQIFTAILIILVCCLLDPDVLILSADFSPACAKNFFVNAAESQLSNALANQDGTLTNIGEDLETLDEVFTIIFLVELLINAFGHWFKPFISDGWNIFDFIVVAMSLVALGPVKVPVNVIRSLRAFRVIRLFGRLKGLKNIVTALASSVIPVLQALLILLIIGSICKHLPC
jgi:hypothetical protein